MPTKKSLKLLRENEELLSTLYKKYAKKFADHQFFWERLSDDEISHANALKALEKLAKVTEKKARFNDTEILEFTSYINIHINKAEDKNHTIKEAIKTALDIEKDLLEKKFFEIFDEDSVELKNAIKYLKKSTDSHLKAVEKAFKKL